MVVNDHFIREDHLWKLSSWPGQVVIPHSIGWKVISKLNWIKILVYSSTLRCKIVQSSIEKFNGLKKLRKTKKILNLNVRVPLESVNFFLHVFLCLKVIFAMEHYIKLLTIFIWKFAIFWSWQLVLWNLGRPGLVVTHFVPRFLYFLHSIFRKVMICQSFKWTPGYNWTISDFLQS